MPGCYGPFSFAAANKLTADSLLHTEAKQMKNFKTYNKMQYRISSFGTNLKETLPHVKSFVTEGMLLFHVSSRIYNSLLMNCFF